MERLTALPYVDANRLLRAFGDQPEVGQSDLLALLDEAPELQQSFRETSLMEYRGETVVWHQYEKLLWSMGESFRRLLKSHRELRTDVLWDRIEALCLDSRYGKGRESFTMLLGQCGTLDRVPVLLRLLDDPQVHGHALYALRLLSAPKAIPQARRLLDDPKAWIRKEARKYLAKVDRQSPPSA